MTLSFFRLGLLALFSTLLMLSGCNSSGSMSCITRCIAMVWLQVAWSR